MYFGESQPIDFLPAYCFIDIIPKSGKLLLATNDFNSGIVRSSVIAASKYEEILNKDVANVDFIYPGEHSISNLKFLFANLVSVRFITCQMSNLVKSIDLLINSLYHVLGICGKSERGCNSAIDSQSENKRILILHFKITSQRVPNRS